MKNSEFKTGKHYRRPSWGGQHYITITPQGNTKSWPASKKYYCEVYSDFYECDKNGDRIEIPPIVAPNGEEYITFDEWVLNLSLGFLGKQSGNEDVTWWYNDGHYYNNFSNEVSKKNLRELKTSFKGNRLFWLCNSKEVDEVIGVVNATCGKEIKGKIMKNCEVEVKVNGKIVELDKKEIIKKVQVIKYCGFWYNEDGELQDTEHFYTKKEAIAEMRKAKHFGETLELFKRYSTLKTDIPVVEKKA